jgi:hypothetical protein
MALRYSIANTGAKPALNKGNVPKPESIPACLTYTDKGLGASILKAGLRLWNESSEDAVATIAVIVNEDTIPKQSPKPLLLGVLRNAIGRLPAGLPTPESNFYRDNIPKPVLNECANTGLIDCGTGACVNISTDPQNCGACGIPCGSGQTCITGKCASMPTDLPG